jgi:hypothetical protein
VLPVLISGQILGFALRFSISAIFGNYGNFFVALCLCPSATNPTPHKVLLKAKTQPQFDRAVNRTVEVVFHVFQGFNRGQFRLVFSLQVSGWQRGAG